MFNRIALAAIYKKLPNLGKRNASGINVISPHIGLSSEQSEFYDLAFSFAQKELYPFAGTYSKCFLRQNIKIINNTY
jgi:hypothetical protein